MSSYNCTAIKIGGEISSSIWEQILKIAAEEGAEQESRNLNFAEFYFDGSGDSGILSNFLRLNKIPYDLKIYATDDWGAEDMSSRDGSEPLAANALDGESVILADAKVIINCIKSSQNVATDILLLQLCNIDNGIALALLREQWPLPDFKLV